MYRISEKTIWLSKILPFGFFSSEETASIYFLAYLGTNDNLVKLLLKEKFSSGYFNLFDRIILKEEFIEIMKSFNIYNFATFNSIPTLDKLYSREFDPTGKCEVGNLINSMDFSLILNDYLTLDEIEQSEAFLIFAKKFVKVYYNSTILIEKKEEVILSMIKFISERRNNELNFHSKLIVSIFFFILLKKINKGVDYTKNNSFSIELMKRISPIFEEDNILQEEYSTLKKFYDLVYKEKRLPTFESIDRNFKSFLNNLITLDYNTELIKLLLLQKT
jgi:hypothetical protein